MPGPLGVDPQVGTGGVGQGESMVESRDACLDSGVPMGHVAQIPGHRQPQSASLRHDRAEHVGLEAVIYLDRIDPLCLESPDERSRNPSVMVTSRD